MLLSLFDNAVSSEMKLKIVRSAKQVESRSTNTKRYLITSKNVHLLSNTDLSDFATKKSFILFEQFELSYNFIGSHPDSWITDENYQDCQMMFRSLKVVNDAAERGVALIEEFNGTLTKNEDQLQYLLQVVQDHRKKYPSCAKT